MRSGTEKKPNPREVSLGKFLSALSRPVSDGYIYLHSGQIVREDTYVANGGALIEPTTRGKGSRR